MVPRLWVSNCARDFNGANSIRSFLVWLKLSYRTCPTSRFPDRQTVTLHVARPLNITEQSHGVPHTVYDKLSMLTNELFAGKFAKRTKYSGYVEMNLFFKNFGYLLYGNDFQSNAASPGNWPFQPTQAIRLLSSDRSTPTTRRDSLTRFYSPLLNKII